MSVSKCMHVVHKTHALSWFVFDSERLFQSSRVSCTYIKWSPAESHTFGCYFGSHSPPQACKTYSNVSFKKVRIWSTIPFICGCNDVVLLRPQIKLRSLAETGASNGIFKHDPFESAEELTKGEKSVTLAEPREPSDYSPKDTWKKQLGEIVKLYNLNATEKSLVSPAWFHCTLLRDYHMFIAFTPNVSNT